MLEWRDDFSHETPIFRRFRKFYCQNILEACWISIRSCKNIFSKGYSGISDISPPFSDFFSCRKKLSAIGIVDKLRNMPLIFFHLQECICNQRKQLYNISLISLIVEVDSNNLLNLKKNAPRTKDERYLRIFMYIVDSRYLGIAYFEWPLISK